MLFDAHVCAEYATDGLTSGIYNTFYFFLYSILMDALITDALRTTTVHMKTY